LFFGIESGDEAFLRKVHNKNNKDNDHVVRILESAMGAGIFVCLSVIVPSPEETEVTKQATFQLLSRAFAKYQNGSVMVLPAFLGTGTMWWNEMEKYGFQFQPGFNKQVYVSKILEWDNHFMFSRNVLADLGYTLGGKSCAELFYECQQFIQQLEKAGIPTLTRK
jgi:radical SAM superfamily enzyme YgiQ (UPF0313 family)